MFRVSERSHIGGGPLLFCSPAMAEVESRLVDIDNLAAGTTITPIIDATESKKDGQIPERAPSAAPAAAPAPAPAPAASAPATSAPAGVAMVSESNSQGAASE